jgi:hypothetical protein
MNYQSIRAKIEGPLLTAYNSQIPAIPVYFDNVTAVPPDPPNEYIRINITFGVMSECTLEGSLDYARGAVIIRCFAQKGKGPARVQELIAIATTVINQINATRKTSTDTYVRIKEISGPAFPPTENLPHFIARIDAGWEARVK